MSEAGLLKSHSQSNHGAHCEARLSRGDRTKQVLEKSDFDRLPAKTGRLHVAKYDGGEGLAIGLSAPLEEALSHSLAIMRRWNQDLHRLTQKRKRQNKEKRRQLEERISALEPQAHVDADIERQWHALTIQRCKLGDESNALILLEKKYVHEKMIQEDEKVYRNVGDNLIRAGRIPAVLPATDDTFLDGELAKIIAQEEKLKWNEDGSEYSLAPSSSAAESGSKKIRTRGELEENLHKTRQRVRAAKNDRSGRAWAQQAYDRIKSTANNAAALPSQTEIDRYVLIERTEAIKEIRFAEKAYKRARKQAKDSHVQIYVGDSLSDDSGISWDLLDRPGSDNEGKKAHALDAIWIANLPSRPPSPNGSLSPRQSERSVSLRTPSIFSELSYEAVDDPKMRSRHRMWRKLTVTRNRDVFERRRRVELPALELRTLHRALNYWMAQKPETFPPTMTEQGKARDPENPSVDRADGKRSADSEIVAPPSKRSRT